MALTDEEQEALEQRIAALEGERDALAEERRELDELRARAQPVPVTTQNARALMRSGYGDSSSDDAAEQARKRLKEAEGLRSQQEDPEGTLSRRGAASAMSLGYAQNDAVRKGAVPPPEPVDPPEAA